VDGIDRQQYDDREIPFHAQEKNPTLNYRHSGEYGPRSDRVTTTLKDFIHSTIFNIANVK